MSFLRMWTRHCYPLSDFLGDNRGHPLDNVGAILQQLQVLLEFGRATMYKQEWYTVRMYQIAPQSAAR
jgi:hypothetical protein